MSTTTTDIITVTADQVREGDVLHMSHGYVGLVIQLPEWEDVDDDDFQVGTIICETFGAFVFSSDEMRVSR